MKKPVALVGAILVGGALLAGNRVWSAGQDEPHQLRAQGPAGLEKFWAAHKSEIEAHKSRLRAAKFGEEISWRAVSRQLDAVAGQHDAWASRLYWFTDLAQAQAVSQAQNKPILSLRMLGKLTDEYSCANSRFFRTALYANAEISQTLRDKYILHWSSERPVPVVTIDMGDGRVLKRTLTGNSAHYLLDAQGRVLDVLPGLYGPGTFHDWLKDSAQMFQSCAALKGAERQAELQKFHEAALGDLVDAYMASSKMQFPKPEQAVTYRANLLKNISNTARLEAPAPQTVPAREAGTVAMTKAIIELSVLDATELYKDTPRVSRAQLISWNGIEPYLPQARLDENSRLLLRSQSPLLEENQALNAQQGAQQMNVSLMQRSVMQAQKSVLPADGFERLVDQFERSLALDTKRNEWNLHAPLRRWIILHPDIRFEELNRLVYDKLFLTPRHDPWLGLAPTGDYTGLNSSGLFEAVPSHVRQAKAPKAQ